MKKANIIDTWLEKNGDPEISKQVEREAEELMLENAARSFILKDYSAEIINKSTLIEKFIKELSPYFIAGAKWQSERMYSKEEVLEQLNLLHNMRSSKIDTYTDENDYITMKWFKQFKK